MQISISPDHAHRCAYTEEMARILSISSFVTRGRVGNSIAVSVLEGLGHEVWAIPTILLSARPGLGTISPVPIPAKSITEIVAIFEADRVLSSVDGLLTGYLSSADHVKAAAEAVARAKSANPDLLYLCDPVMGDEGKGLYIDKDAANLIRNELVPLAGVITPNAFELKWLAESDSEDLADLAHQMEPDIIAVTSASSNTDKISNLLCTSGEIQECTSPRIFDVPNGTGDLFSALLLSELLSGQSARPAFERTCMILEKTAAESSGAEILDLRPALRTSGFA